MKTCFLQLTVDYDKCGLVILYNFHSFKRARALDWCARVLKCFINILNRF